jgi:hypothetical protein
MPTSTRNSSSGQALSSDSPEGWGSKAGFSRIDEAQYIPQNFGDLAV